MSAQPPAQGTADAPGHAEHTLPQPRAVAGTVLEPEVEEALAQLARQLFGEAGAVPGWINACGQADRTVLTVEQHCSRLPPDAS